MLKDKQEKNALEKEAALRVAVLTIFPEIFASFLETSLIKKAIERGKLVVSLIQIRDFASPPHFQTDDAPFGGGAGMVMKPEPLALAIEHAKARLPQAKVVLLAPTGRTLTQAMAQEFSSAQEIILVCGRYEGLDQRVVDLLVDQEISIGDYVLMGGEIPSMVVIEAVTRLVDEVVGNEESLKDESFVSFGTGPQLLEAPHYTRPAEFRGLKVPEALLSGNHQKIAEWRQEKSLERTKIVRPDLLQRKKQIL